VDNVRNVDNVDNVRNVDNVGMWEMQIMQECIC